jgi:hypothetical protein
MEGSSLHGSHAHDEQDRLRQFTRTQEARLHWPLLSIPGETLLDCSVFAAFGISCTHQ